MEDVQYLKRRSKEDSYLFVVDSSKRDKNAYPNPSDYTIQFNAPFKNVLGIELLDASIPRTEYVVDDTCNTIVYSIDGGEKKTVTVQPGDYNLLQFCEALSADLEGDLAVEPLSSPYSQTSKLKFTCPSPFTIHLSETTMRKQLGFAGTEKTYSSSLASDSTTTRAFLGPYPGFDTVNLSTGECIRQAFSPSTTGRASSVNVYADQVGGDISVSIRDADDVVYGTGTLKAFETSQVVLQNADILTAGETYYIVLQALNGGSVFVNAPTDGLDPAETSASMTGPWIMVAGQSLACDVWVGIGQQELISPHLVDLTGVRYVMVRCPEIETYMYRERAYEPYYAGLGMVKLGVNGIRDQRYDFVSFPRRSLTIPLGKLSSLSFRLEKPDGTIYNSRGIDHTLVLVMRYYTSIQPDDPIPSALNPHYLPNPIDYYNETKWKMEMDARDTQDAWRRSS